MKMENDTTRPYRMTARARSKAQTGQSIVDAAYQLFRESSLDAVTLQGIADRAGVTVQTVIRHFGSKEGVVEAAIRSVAGGMQAHREKAAVGDVAGALAVLVDHYEREGEATLRVVALEDKLEAARTITSFGRKMHREWCARVFAPYLPESGEAGYDGWLDAYVGATDLYLWKLFRLDLGRSREETTVALTLLAEGLARRNHPGDTK